MKWYRRIGLCCALIGGVLGATAKVHAQGQADSKLVLLTPDFCPLICRDGDDTAQDAGNLTAHLKAAFTSIGYDLDIQFDRQSRSRVKVAMGQADIVLGPYPELSKNSKLNLIEAPVANVAIGAVSRMDMPLAINTLDDLLNYRIVWNTSAQVSPEVAAAFTKQKEAGLLKRLPPTTFKEDATRMIGDNEADIMFGQVSDLNQAMADYRSRGGQTVLMLNVVYDLPIYALHIAFSPKADIDEAQLAQLKQFFIDNPFVDEELF